MVRFLLSALELCAIVEAPKESALFSPMHLRSVQSEWSPLVPYMKCPVLIRSLSAQSKQSKLSLKGAQISSALL